jgi:hypothetical protein
MALLANTNTIANKGRNIPIPFRNKNCFPDKFSERYTNNPNKIKFKIISICQEQIDLSFFIGNNTYNWNRCA